MDVSLLIVGAACFVFIDLFKHDFDYSQKLLCTHLLFDCDNLLS